MSSSLKQLIFVSTRTHTYTNHSTAAHARSNYGLLICEAINYNFSSSPSPPQFKILDETLPWRRHWLTTCYKYRFIFPTPTRDVFVGTLIAVFTPIDTE